MAAVGQTTVALEQAGGGASDAMRETRVFDSTVISYLKHIFESHADADGTWSVGQVERFIQQVQKNDAGTGPAVKLLNGGTIDLNRFLQYMASADTSITLPCTDTDLSWPLSSYFISSSHNTYLSGNQLYGDSTTDSYTNVLLRGCRCVEIDVWDGDESDLSESSDSADEKAEVDASIKRKKRSAFNKFKQRIPESLSTKLKKTSLGKPLDHRDREKHYSGSGSERASDGEEKLIPEVALVEPQVFHGYTLTKEVSFRDVCKAIRKSAFTVTEMPLIVSLEVHCGQQQQFMMARIMKEVWADMLVTESEVKTAVLPDLAELKRKILIKVKYSPPNAQVEDVDSAEDDRLPSEAPPPKKPSKVVHELSKLGIYTQAITFKSWTQHEASMPTHIFSLAEKKFLESRERNGKALFEHNRNYLLRAYPSGLRIGSSNMMPAAFWGSGAQIVALNWQETDTGMMLNEAMFAGTGGYVLKPEGYRPNLPSKSRPNTICHKALDLTLTFLAAQSIPLPPGDKSDRKFRPYIKTEVHVDGSDSSTHEGQACSDGREPDTRYKARTKTRKGSDIDLEKQKISFHELDGLVEDLTFVRFTVRDDELGVDDLAAWACVRLDRLGQGYRFIHLLDAKGRLTDGTILVKVEKTLATDSQR